MRPESEKHGLHGIAIRIYVVTVAVVIAIGAALFLVLALARERSESRGRVHALTPDVARMAAARVAQGWPSGERMRQEIDGAARWLPLRISVYRWGGELVATGEEPPVQRLQPRELDEVWKAGYSERRVGRASPGDFAFGIPGAGGPVGYVVVRLLLPSGPRSLPPGSPPPLTPLLATLALLLAGIGIAAVVLGGSLARPLDRLARTARALGAGELAARTGIVRRDEVGAVARAFDDMADRVNALVRGQTELIANVAHELRTPLARIRVALDLAADGDAAVARESLAEINEDLAELETLVNDVLTSARMDLAANTSSGGTPPLRHEPLDVAGVAGLAAERMRHRFPERRLEVELESGLPEAVGDPVLLRRVVDNLLDNARKYSPPESAIRLLAHRLGAALAIEVVDRGEGLSAAELEQLFTPFFRADRSRARSTGGVGLGLALSRRIAEAHGGTLEARSARGAGTTMTVTLPAAPCP